MPTKRHFLLAISGMFFFGKSKMLLAQNLKPVQMMQAQFPQYQPEALKKLAIDANAIQLDIPALVDSGNSIPFTIKLKVPGQRQIRSFEIIAPENPFPRVLGVNLPNPHGKYQLSTRIRLALSQDVWVIVTLDNDQKIANSVPAVVTLNACFDAT